MTDSTTTTMTTTTITTTTVDGRTQRRIQGRQATLDATIDLLLSGTMPSVELVCSRAGISQASLFRYFKTVDEWRQAVVGRYFERFDHLFSLTAIGEGTLDDRVERLVADRDRLYTAIEPMARFARVQATNVDELNSVLTRVRSTLADQVAQHFAAELGRLEPAEQTRTVHVLAALTSFETWDQLSSLGSSQRRLALQESVTVLIPASADEHRNEA